VSAITTRRTRQRPPAPDEQVDHEIKPGDYFGTTSSKGGQVWYFDGSKAVRAGVPNPDYRSMATVEPGETLRDALARVPMFASETFILHRMVLPPGAYYPRIARPVDQHPDDVPSGRWEPGSADVLVGTLNQVRSLVGMLDAIFQAVHPSAANMSCFGSATRNLIILACTECEAQWRGVLLAHSYSAARLKTDDYVKLMPAMRLGEYQVKLQHFPWLPAIAPYSGWEASAPTQTLPWYDDYNAVKHDREASFERATLENAISSVAAVWVMIAAQFGVHGVREFDDLSRYFHLASVPRWRYSDAYTYGYDGFNSEAGARKYPF